MQGESRLKSQRSRPGAASVAALGAIVCALALTATPAMAQQAGNAQALQSQSLRQRMFDRGLPETGRFVSSGGDAFVLDSSGPRPLFRHDRSSEIWVLRGTPAPRGDVIYRNDAGEQVLRVTPDGQLTLYTPRAPNGVPVSASGEAAPLAAPAMSMSQLFTHLIRQSDLAGRALGHTVEISAPDLTVGSEDAVADTITVAVDSLIRMARNVNLRAQAAEVDRILIVEGAAPAARFSNGTLQLVIQPGMGPAGRPSSALIVRVVSN